MSHMIPCPAVAEPRQAGHKVAISPPQVPSEPRMTRRLPQPIYRIGRLVVGMYPGVRASAPKHGRARSDGARGSRRRC